VEILGNVAKMGQPIPGKSSFLVYSLGVLKQEIRGCCCIDYVYETLAIIEKNIEKQ
jgi:hypothetical protein